MAAPGVYDGGIFLEVPVGGKATPNRFYMLYEFPPGSSQYVAYQFDSKEQANQTFGVANVRGIVRPQEWMTTQVLAISSATEIIGGQGQWGRMMEQVVRESAQKAGVTDPSLVGRMATNREMQRLMGLAAVGNWTPEQIKAAQRGTNFWQNELYPGIANFYGRTSNPEQAWMAYSQSVEPALLSLGYQRGKDGTFNAQIKQMLDRGVDAQTFLENVPVFQQAIQNSQFFNILRQRAKAELGKDLKFGDWFALLKGEAATDIQRVAQGAVVAYEAQQARVGLGENVLQRLVRERDLTADQARGVFSEVSQAVLALGDIGLRRGGLQRDDIISAMAGIAPSSGRSPEEVKQLVGKLALEEQLFDEDKIQFFMGFSPQGTPHRPGLQALAPG